MCIRDRYFIRLMGNQPSHMALECALKTNPNAVIISEECVDRKETLRDIVNNLCEIVVDRARDKKNFGAILIPEGLLSQIASFDQMIIELNQVFAGAKTVKEQAQMAKTLYDEEEIKKVLSPWSYSIFITLPEFFRHQILVEREMAGTIKLSQLETERLLAYLVGQELESRRKAGTYNGTFAPVTHFFGYQGRSAHPSHFDCSLASTYGFAAGRLVESGLTAHCVSVHQIT